MINHVGIIMDGNRRFARRLMKEPSKGHEWGAKKVKSLFDWCTELGIRNMTLYSLSLENFNRPKPEFDYLMKIFRKEFTALKSDERLTKDKIRIRFLGRIGMLPTDVQDLMCEIQDLTEGHDGYTVNFAIAYGGQGEIVDAARSIAKAIEHEEITSEEVDEDLFRKYLYMDDSPDLIIRTGGDRRTSNFLCYQSAYSEWFFIDKMWPEFEKQDLVDVIDEFKRRKRRFGR